MSSTDRYQIARQGYTTSLYDMPLLITYNMTYMCNYHCTYCGQHGNRPKSPDWLSTDKIKAMFLNLRKLNRPEYLITLSGGEPTIHPHFIETVSNMEAIFRNRLSCLTVISNGSRNPDVYRELLRFSKNLPLELNISLHTDHMKLDHIVELIEKFAHDSYLNLQLMFNPDKREFVHSIYDELCVLRKKKPFDLAVVQLRDFARNNAVDGRYTKEDFAFIDSSLMNFQKIASTGQPAKQRNRNFKEFMMTKSSGPTGAYEFVPVGNYSAAQRRGDFAHKGRYCAMGTHQLLIHPNGKASNAICMQAHCTSFPLYEKDPYEDPEFANISVCRMENCGCPTNHYLQKFQIKKEAENYLDHFRIKTRRYEEDYKREIGLQELVNKQGELLNRFMLTNGDFRSLVDENFYYQNYPDVKAAGIPAAEHYFLYGWKEGRNPRRDFHTCEILNENKALRYLQVCPLIIESLGKAINNAEK